MYAIRSYYEHDNSFDHFAGYLLSIGKRIKFTIIEDYVHLGTPEEFKEFVYWQDRITSYNVCYTKLLRYIIIRLWQNKFLLFSLCTGKEQYYSQYKKYCFNSFFHKIPANKQTL